DVTTGVVINGRPEVQDGEQILGLFLNTVPFRLQIKSGSWSELIRATFAVEQQSLPHRRCPMAMLKQRHAAGRELFDTAFGYLHFHVYKNVNGKSQNVILKRGGFAQHNFPFHINFEISPATGRIKCLIEHNLNRVREKEGARIAAYYAHALKMMVETPGSLHDSRA